MPRQGKELLSGIESSAECRNHGYVQLFQSMQLSYFLELFGYSWSEGSCLSWSWVRSIGSNWANAVEKQGPRIEDSYFIRGTGRLNHGSQSKITPLHPCHSPVGEIHFSPLDFLFRFASITIWADAWNMLARPGVPASTLAMTMDHA